MKKLFDYAPISPLSATLELDDYLLATNLLNEINNHHAPKLKVTQWEKVFSDWLGGMTTSAWAGGRTALYVAIKALNLNPGDEVIVPAFTCQAVINAFIFNGIKPIYADIEEFTYGLDISAVKKAFNPKVKAIMLQYTFGLISRDLEEVLYWAKQNDLWIIEDCAHSLGATWQGNLLGTLGDIAIFSSERSKIINTVHGGMCATRHSDLSKRLIELRDEAPQVSVEKTKLLLQTLMVLYEQKNGLKPSYHLDETLPQMFPEEFTGQFVPHYFETMSEAIAVLSLNQFSKLSKFQKQRDRAVIFWDHWCDFKSLQKPFVLGGSKPTFLRYPVFVGEENKLNLKQYIDDLNVLPGVWFSSAAHPTPVKLDHCPVGTTQATGCINMPTLLPNTFYQYFE